MNDMQKLMQERLNALMWVVVVLFVGYAVMSVGLITKMLGWW